MLSKKTKTEVISLKIKNETHSLHPSLENFQNFINERASRVYEIIKNTIISIQKYKILEIFSNSDVVAALDALDDLYKKTELLASKKINSISETDVLMADLQFIFDKLSVIIMNYGTQKIEDIFYVTFGSDFKIREKLSEDMKAKHDLLKYASFIGYKILTCKQKPESHKNENLLCVDKITENNIVIENSNHLECYDPTTISRSFHHSIFGTRIAIKNEKEGKILILSGSVEDISVEWLMENKYVKARRQEIDQSIIRKNNQDVDATVMNRLFESFSLKDILVYGNGDIHKKYIALTKDVQFVKNNRIDVIIKYFTDMDVIHQRKMIINLLIYNKDLEVQYVAYMLYDLISYNNGDPSSIDSIEQKLIYDSFPWKIKMFFKEAMKNTIQYSHESLNKSEIARVSIEQQIILMKTSDAIKDRAISKLKEIKGKPDDQGNKAKQYLEGLLRIPFGMCKEEPVLKIIRQINMDFTDFMKSRGLNVIKNKYTAVEISKYIQGVNDPLKAEARDFIKSYIKVLNKPALSSIVKLIEPLSETTATSCSSKPKPQLLDYINKFLEKLKGSNTEMNIYKKITAIGGVTDKNPIQQHDVVVNINSKLNKVKESITEITDTLDGSIYGHSHAKNQILKIIAQWINGEQSGYCFGFEGSPGVGKTSLAKRGLARCLQDEIGESRPFAFIALGGSCNGSTLEGHNYTYVNAQWGKIVDILMETKCMNPIIYIDELDKVSKTEQGKEIIGILTHLIDYTQNDEFQDKYFSGIPIDLSKALFIFSYNDPEQIDRILLDRIHRIKFDNLSTQDKKVIVNNFVLPEINRKMGFDSVIELLEETVEYIIEFYTMESGIRKLKEILFDLYGEINIELLRIGSDIELQQIINIPITVKVEDLGKKYLKKYSRIHEKLVHSIPKIGVINGLWANSLGKGGIIPIEVSFFPSSTFLELKLTGLQGDVMKESMNIAKTLAWTLTPDEIKSELMQKFDKTKNQGLHIHCPEGAVSKDGPSAGAAITLSIYSLFNNINISNKIAITGEINLQGNITAIGGLDVKIMGGIRAGVKKFMYPVENKRDFEDCYSKHKDFFEERQITFQDVSQIQDVFKHVYI